MGVTIVSIATALLALLGIIAGLILILSMNSSGVTSSQRGLFQPFGVLSLILGLIGLGVAWGLWRVQGWAYWGTIVLQAINIVVTGFGWLTTPSGASTLLAILGLVVPAAILVYFLISEDVRTTFRLPGSRAM